MEVTRLHFLLSLWPLQISHSSFFSFSSLSVSHSEVTSAVLHLLREWGWSIEIFTKKKKVQAFLYIISSDMWNHLINSGILKGFTISGIYAVLFVHILALVSDLRLYHVGGKKKENPLEVFYLYDFHIEIKEMKENKLK